MSTAIPTWIWSAAARHIYPTLPQPSVPRRSESHPLAQFVGNDGINEMWINDGSGTFVLSSSGPAGGTSYTKTAAWADIDNDNDMDLV